MPIINCSIRQSSFKSLVKATYASAITGVVVYFIGKGLISVIWINLTLSLCIGALIYFILLFLFHEFQTKEKEEMRQILARYLYRVSL